MRNSIVMAKPREAISQWARRFHAREFTASRAEAIAPQIPLYELDAAASVAILNADSLIASARASDDVGNSSSVSVPPSPPADSPPSSAEPATAPPSQPSATAAAGAITPTPSPLGCQCPRRKCGPCTNIHELNANGISTLCCEILADGSCNCPCPSCNPEEDEVSQPSPTPSIAAGTASRPPSPQPAQPLVADPSKQSAWRRWLARVWQTLQHALHGNTSTVIANTPKVEGVLVRAPSQHEFVCPFAERCTLAVEQGRAERPPEIAIADDHTARCVRIDDTLKAGR